MRTKVPSKLRKRRVYSENSSDVLGPHNAGEIWKRYNHRSFSICVWKQKRQGSHVIIVTSLFSKCFPSTRNASVFKFLLFEERFRKAAFSWRIRMGCRSSRRNKSRVFKFLRRSLDRALLWFWLSNINSTVRVIVTLTACVSSAFLSSHRSTAFLARAFLQSVF